MRKKIKKKYNRKIDKLNKIDDKLWLKIRKYGQIISGVLLIFEVFYIKFSKAVGIDAMVLLVFGLLMLLILVGLEILDSIRKSDNKKT